MSIGPRSSVFFHNFPVLLFAWMFAVVATVGPVAAHAEDANDSAIRAVWLVGKNELVSVNPHDGAVLKRITGLRGVGTVLADDRRERVWAYGRNTLYGFDSGGETVITQELPRRHSRGDDDDDEDDDDEGPNHRWPRLVLDPGDGGLWLVRGRWLHRFDAAGTVTFEKRFRKKIRALAFDPVRSRLWLAEHGNRALQALDAGGRAVATLTPTGKRPRIRDIAFDIALDRLWVALEKRTIHAYDGDGQRVFAKALKKRGRKADLLAPDGRGGVWLAGHKGIVHLTDGGETSFSLRKLGLKGGRINGLAVDPDDRSLWIATQKGLRHLDENGGTLLALDFFNKGKKRRRHRVPPIIQWIRTMALSFTPDPPTLTLATPAQGALINDATPSFVMTYEDWADPSTILFEMNQTALSLSCQPEPERAVCLPDAPLPEGSVTLTATIADPYGHVSEPVARTFTVDTIPPTITVTAPVDGLLTNQPAQTVSGTLSEAAALTINAQTVGLGDDNAFQWPTTFAEGENHFELTATDPAGNAATVSVTATLDTIPPTLSITTPASGLFTSDTTPAIELEMDGGPDVQSLIVQANGTTISPTCTPKTGGLSCQLETPLADGPFNLTATVADAAGNRSDPAQTLFTVDTLPPVITLTVPEEGVFTNLSGLTVTGALNEPGTVTVNGQPALFGPDNGFQATHTLQEGENSLVIAALDRAGNAASLTRVVTLDTQPPAAPDADLISVTTGPDGTALINGTAGSVEAWSTVIVSNDTTGDTLSVAALIEGVFSATIAARSGEGLSLSVVDRAGNTGPGVILSIDVLPPDPVAVAPEIDPTAASNVATTTQFLYTGENPIQTGVEPGVMEPERAAVVRGSVKSTDGSILSGVGVSILGRPEFGQTQTRSDGALDMALNGGGTVVVLYEKEGYLPVHRQIKTEWQRWGHLPEVVMTRLDTKVTTVDLASPEPIQVAQGSKIVDEDGERQATVLFPQGLQASMVLPDGSSQPLTSLNVRATEFTVGPDGPKAMPAVLPPTSGYTYAVELSVDEALAAGAETVEFSAPIPVYIDNFLDFKVGGPVPTAYYDRERAVWVPIDDGLIIGVLGVENGLAQLDLDGSGTAAAGEALAEQGITSAEQIKLASLYEPGKSFWRFRTTHFTPFDCNFPVSPPDVPTPGESVPPPRLADVKIDDSAKKCGSIIDCQNQTLGQSIPVSGTPFSLNYHSGMVKGRKGNRTVIIPLTGDTVHPELLRIDLEVGVGGRVFKESFSPGPDLTYQFRWDNKDVYGREMSGQQPVLVRLGYVYEAFYYAPRSFGRSFGLRASEIMEPSRPARQDVTLWRTSILSVGNLDVEKRGFGGWGLTGHHFYDTRGNKLMLGDGSWQDPNQSYGYVITEIKKNWKTSDGNYIDVSGETIGYSEIGVLLSDPDGGFYAFDYSDERLLRISSDGYFSIISGGYDIPDEYVGDGGPATEAKLGEIVDMVTGTDGSLYLADHYFQRIRRIDPDGIITTIAGTGEDESSESEEEDDYSSDRISGRLAAEVFIGSPTSLDIGIDGSIYFTTDGDYFVYKISPDGTIAIVAGSQDPVDYDDNGGSVDGLLAVDVEIYPGDISLADDGNLYIVDQYPSRILRVDLTGVLSVIVDQETYSMSGFEGTFNPREVITDRSGGVFIVTWAGVGKVTLLYYSPEGTLRPIANGGEFKGDGSLALQSGLWVGGLFIDSSGDLIVGSGLKLTRPFSGLNNSDHLIASSDGRELHKFEDSGKHLSTRDALSRAVLYNYIYDNDGLLIQITDRDGGMTVIERNDDGDPIAIIAPGGQRTTLTLDGNGYLASVKNPAGETFHLTHTVDGLLTRFVNPRGKVSTSSYDEGGRLLREENAGGGSWQLQRTESESGLTSSVSSALGRTSTYIVEKLPSGGESRLNTAPDGTVMEIVNSFEGKQTITRADGTILTIKKGPDPLFGMQVPLNEEVKVTTPGGLISTTTSTKTIDFAEVSGNLNLTQVTDRTTVNGQNYTRTYDAEQKTPSQTTPEGQFTFIINDKGRIIRSETSGFAASDYVYDDEGHLTSITTGEGDDTRTQTFTYDSGGYLTGTTDSLGQTTTFENDPLGRVTRQTLPGGQEVRLEYDQNGNLTSLTPPGRVAHLFHYTALDQESAYTPPDIGSGEETTQYFYDLDQDLKKVLRPDGKEILFNHDPVKGRLNSITAPRGSYDFTYDATGRVNTMGSPDGGALAFTYDGFLPLSTIWTGAVSGSVKQAYDDDFRVISRTVNNVTIEYDHDYSDGWSNAGELYISRTDGGLINSASVGHIGSRFEYNQFGEVTKHLVKWVEQGIYFGDIDYDNLGRIVQKSEYTPSLDENVVYNYGYDLAGRLVEVKINGVVTAAYTYDENGNRLTRSAGGVAETGFYDAQDRLVRYGGAEYTHTANGERLSKTDADGTTSYDYDVFGNLRTVLLPDGQQVDYVIDAADRRISKKLDGTLVQGFLYRDALNPIAELDGSGNVVSRFVYGDQANIPAYMIKGGTNYRFITDHLGSPRLIINADTGEIVQRIDYDEFGNITQDTNPAFQPFGFAGGLHDHHTNLVRFGTRDYDPQVGRWTAKDPIRFDGDGPNLYGYVLNDPVNLVDPLGLWYVPSRGVVNFFAGFGDGVYSAATLGFGDLQDIRDILGHGYPVASGLTTI